MLRLGQSALANSLINTHMFSILTAVFKFSDMSGTLPCILSPSQQLRNHTLFSPNIVDGIYASLAALQDLLCTLSNSRINCNAVNQVGRFYFCLLRVRPAVQRCLTLPHWDIPGNKLDPLSLPDCQLQPANN